MKFKELNNNIKCEYVNTFKICPSPEELSIDFGLIDNAATRFRAEEEGREKPEEIILETKARLVMSPAIVQQLFDALNKIIVLPIKTDKSTKEEDN